MKSRLLRRVTVYGRHKHLLRKQRCSLICSRANSIFPTHWSLDAFRRNSGRQCAEARNFSPVHLWSSKQIENRSTSLKGSSYFYRNVLDESSRRADDEEARISLAIIQLNVKSTGNCRLASQLSWKRRVNDVSSVVFQIYNASFAQKRSYLVEPEFLTYSN